MGRGLQTALFIAVIIFFIASLHSPVLAEGGAKDMYKAAYECLLEAEMAGEPKKAEAAAKWADALEKLRDLQKTYPDWNRMIVESKIRECEAALQKRAEEKPVPPAEDVTGSEVAEQPVPVGKRPTELQQHLARGNELASKKKYNEAIEEYKKALGIDPNNSIAYLNIATCLMDQDKDDDAIRMLKKALQADPVNASAHFKLGKIYLEKDMIDMAVAEYKTVLKANPDDPEAHWEIAGLYWNIKKLDDSINHYDRAAELLGETTPEGLDAIRNSEKIKLIKQQMRR